MYLRECSVCMHMSCMCVCMYVYVCMYICIVCVCIVESRLNLPHMSEHVLCICLC